MAPMLDPFDLTVHAADRQGPDRSRFCPSVVACVEFGILAGCLTPSSVHCLIAALFALQQVKSSWRSTRLHESYPVGLAIRGVDHELIWCDLA